MKLGRIVNDRFHEALTKLTKQPLPLRTAFKLKGIAAKVKEEISKYEEVRHEALERWGNHHDNGSLVLNPDQSVQFEPQNLTKFAEELNKLGDTEIELDSISVSELPDDVQLSAEDVALLEGLLVE